jgi:peptidyl-prolyl cis-trans isomerase B (cyclophilin B)
MNKKILFFLLLLIATTSYGQKAKTTVNTHKKSAHTRERLVLIHTAYGDMKVKLYNETPAYRDTFIALVKRGFYDSLLFHRVIKNFMIQGGDPQSKHAPAGQPLGNGDIGYTLPAAFNDSLIHKKGALCAARTDNPAKASSACQFYIVQGKVQTDAELNAIEQRGGFKYSDKQRNIYKTLGGTPFLDRGYTVYGEVVEGLDVIDKIEAVQTGQGDRPVKDVWMTMKVIR